MTDPAIVTHRPSAPASVAGHSARQHDWLVGQLPAGMLADDFFVRFVRIFQAEAHTLLSHADTLPHLADPRLAPIEMVRYLSGWLAAPEVDDAYGPHAQRQMLLTVAKTLPWRGTRKALVTLLELYSGAPVTISESGGVFDQGRAPDGARWVRLEVTSTGPLAEEDFVELVRDEVPAHVGVEIVVAGRQIWPGDGSAPAAGRQER
ncbi:phage tail protein [Ruania alba]|uniref:Phage tail protein domain-containing protein n=1 Tax=Ruania alba TaxID=648782 RepID=A0A1H5KMW7_9MICO|nr:phage tail protein [Ruania alba]SEE66125.1 phage tail protein domain-containing protein [Ruania alba]